MYTNRCQLKTNLFKFALQIIILIIIIVICYLKAHTTTICCGIIMYGASYIKTYRKIMNTKNIILLSLLSLIFNNTISLQAMNSPGPDFDENEHQIMLSRMIEDIDQYEQEATKHLKIAQEYDEVYRLCKNSHIPFCRKISNLTNSAMKYHLAADLYNAAGNYISAANNYSKSSHKYRSIAKLFECLCEHYHAQYYHAISLRLHTHAKLIYRSEGCDGSRIQLIQ